MLATVILFSSCKKDDVDYASAIVGSWKFSGYSAEVRINNNEIAKAVIKEKLENRENTGADIITFTADNKFLANSKEIGTYSIAGNKLTVTETDNGSVETVELKISGNNLSVISDMTVFYQAELPYFGFELDSFIIQKLLLTTKYVKQ